MIINWMTFAANRGTGNEPVQCLKRLFPDGVVMTQDTGAMGAIHVQVQHENYGAYEEWRRAWWAALTEADREEWTACSLEYVQNEFYKVR